MTTQTENISYSWGGSSRLTSALICAKYGYWSKGQAPSEWFDAELELAEKIADIVQPPDVKYTVTFDKEMPGEVEGHFKCWDEANKWCEPWEVGFRFKSKESVLSNYKQEYENHKRLHGGVINALLHYKETGEPIEPEWLPVSGTNFHWLRKDYKPNDYCGFRPLKRANSYQLEMQT